MLQAKAVVQRHRQGAGMIGVGRTWCPPEAASVEHDVAKQNGQRLGVAEVACRGQGLANQLMDLQAQEDVVDQRKAADPAGLQSEGRFLLTDSSGCCGKWSSSPSRKPTGSLARYYLSKVRKVGCVCIEDAIWAD